VFSEYAEREGDLRRHLYFVQLTVPICGNCVWGNDEKHEILLQFPFDSTCPVRHAKINSFALLPKSKQNPRCLVPLEGRIAIVTDAGRDAVDADAPLTNGAKADGEVVWS
jgi:hypothetical protein